MMSAAGLAIILLVLLSFDSRVREQVQLRVSSPSGALTDAGHGLKTVMEAVTDAMRDRSLDRAPLLVFVCGAGVLLLFMLRT